MKFLSYICISIFLIASASAVVDYSNGNYFQDFIDLKVPYKNSELTFRRTYNSVSANEGLFGKGWGSSFEIGIRFVEGTIVLTEMGNGRHHIYTLENESIDSALKLTVEKIKKSSQLKGESLKSLKERIILDPQMLDDYVEVQSRPKAGKYRSLNNVFLELAVTENQLSFNDSESNKWVTDFQGKIQTWTPHVGGEFSAKYTDHLLDSLFNKELYIQFKYKDKKIAEIQFGAAKARYTFKDQFLTLSRDQNSNEYRYAYETDKLVHIKGSDVDETINYDLKTGRVKSVKNKDDESFYTFNIKTQPTLIKSTEIQSKLLGKAKYEYEYKVGKEGPYLYRRKIDKQNVVSEITFDECCGRPLKIVDKRGEVKAEYLENGLPLKLQLPLGEKYSWEWNGSNQLIQFNAPNEVRKYKYQKGKIAEIDSSLQGSLKLHYGQEDITKAIHSKNGEDKVYQFVRSLKGNATELIIDGGKKIFLTKGKSGSWELDPKKKHDAQSRMQLFVWLQLNQQLINVPKVDEIIGRF